jgi:hypothetical protein
VWLSKWKESVNFQWKNEEKKKFDKNKCRVYNLINWFKLQPLSVEKYCYTFKFFEILFFFSLFVLTLRLARLLTQIEGKKIEKQIKITASVITSLNPYNCIHSLIQLKIAKFFLHNTYIDRHNDGKIAR